MADPPPPPDASLPGESQGKINACWLAPYVRASAGFGGTTITWFTKEGQIKRQASVSGIEPGFVNIIGPHETILGVNEDWHITLPSTPSSAPPGYITSTMDSRVFIHEYHPQPGEIALDIYLHGQFVNTVGPYLDYLGRDVELNEDGSAALTVWKDKSHTMPQIITTDTNGIIRCREDGLTSVVAPGGALLHPPTQPSLGQNPFCMGWVPQSHQALFSTSIGYEYHYQLVDWDTGKILWKIRCPGNEKAQVLSVGFTSKLIIFAVAELFQPGPWRGEQWSLANSGKEWIRTFHAVNIHDGRLAARWQAQYPQRLGGEERDHFLSLGDDLFYVTGDEVVKLNPTDIITKKNGWQ